jgi:hypothetical protein
MANITPDNPAVKEIVKYLLILVSEVPNSELEAVDDPEREAKVLINKAAAKAAVTSGAMSIPPGPMGMLTILPDLYLVWKIQSRMIGDVAALYGQSAKVTREQMLYCLFRHAAMSATRDLVVRLGERWLIQQQAPFLLQKVLNKIGVSIAKKAGGKTLARWMPIVGVVGMGAYAFYDTVQVGKTALELYSKPIEVKEKSDNSSGSKELTEKN